MSGPTVCVVGLWHLGCTIAACLAAAGLRVSATDPDATRLDGLRRGRLPVAEPGLEELVRAGSSSGHLTLEASGEAAVRGADVVWIAFDTPVNERDEPDAAFVQREVERLVPSLDAGAVVLVSSQVPVGFTRQLRDRWCASSRPPGLRFAYSPENLRLGTAIESFRNPDRVVIGTEAGGPDETLERVLGACGGTRLWMTLESAEMTKHALNAFLATSIVFINEIARLAEAHGADARDVERGLKSEARIGPRAYLSAGPAFSGGTLARDLRSLERLGACTGRATPLLSAVLASNAEHARWPRAKLRELLGELRGIRVAVLGLTYKPGTDTLRRSSALELCEWLAGEGALVRAHDPSIPARPAGVDPRIDVTPSPADALMGAEAAVLATPWPEYRALSADLLASTMKTARVLDAPGFLAAALDGDPRIQYLAVGRPGPGRSSGRPAS